MRFTGLKTLGRNKDKPTNRPSLPTPFVGREPGPSSTDKHQSSPNPTPASARDLEPATLPSILAVPGPTPSSYPNMHPQSEQADLNQRSPSRPTIRIVDEDGMARTRAAVVSRFDGSERLDGAEEQLSFLHTRIESGSDAISQVNALFASTTEEKDLVQKVDRFVEGSHILMSALDDIQKIHPFIGVAVLAFKAVWKLEELRRDNEKKVRALFTEMGEMMSVLLDLGKVRTGPNDPSPEARLGDLVQRTADDIKSCGNVCDTYSKKRLIVKAIQSPVWDKRLLDFVRLFATRRNDFGFALAIYTAGVTTTVDQKATDIQAKVDLLLKLFHNALLSPEQKDLNRLIQQKGGADVVQQQDDVLIQLASFAKYRQSSTSSDRRRRDSVSTRAGPVPMPTSEDITELKRELKRTPEDSIAVNERLFNQKFDRKLDQIKEEFIRVVERQGDRVIEVLQAGAHDQILDEDLRDLWKAWDFKGSVKARTFIMAFRDFFQKKLVTANLVPPESPIQAISPIMQESSIGDAWALQYLKISNVQPIQEAFDDDASGYISVAEANAFTKNKPSDWSVPEWAAFWAIGWHMALWEYKVMIEELQNKMFALLPNVLPENRGSVDDYLVQVDQHLTMLTSSLNYYDGDDLVKAKFWGYVLNQERRLERALSTFNYHIDAFETVSLVTGPGRIEQFILPLVYILLKRHFELFRICTKRVIWREELIDAAASLKWCFVAVDDRAAHLYSLFKQQRLDPKDHFAAFAHGLFDYWYSPDLWAGREFPETPFHDDGRDIEETVLRHGLGPRLASVSAAEPDAVPGTPESLSIEPSISCILGSWHGVFYNSGGTHTDGPMFALSLRIKDKDSMTVHGTASIDTLRYKIEGRYTAPQDNGPIAIELRLVEKQGHYTTIALSGEYYPSNDSIVGLRELTQELGPDSDFLLLSALPPEILRRYRPVGTSSSRAGRARAAAARWKWIGSMIIANARERNYSASKAGTENGARAEERPIVPSELNKDRLRALWRFAATNIRGTFLLSRLSPENLRFYPYPEDLERQRCRTLWKYAISCTIARLRSEGWNKSHFDWRRRDRMRYLELLSLSPSANTPEFEELREWQKLHTPSDEVVFRSQASFRIQGTFVNHGVSCSACGGRVGQARIICLDCSPTNSPTGKVDICTSCLQKPVMRDDLSEHHLPSHNMMKITQVLHHRYHKTRLREASRALNRARMAFEGLGAGSVSWRVAVSCSSCRQNTKPPCWFCVNCHDDVFICRECDESGHVGQASFKGPKGHTSEHALVWVHFEQAMTLTVMSESVDRMINERMAPLHERLDRLEAMLANFLQSITVSQTNGTAV